MYSSGPASIIYNERGHRADEDEPDVFPEDEADTVVIDSMPRSTTANRSESESRTRTPGAESVNHNKKQPSIPPSGVPSRCPSTSRTRSEISHASGAAPVISDAARLSDRDRNRSISRTHSVSSKNGYDSDRRTVSSSSRSKDRGHRNERIEVPRATPKIGEALTAVWGAGGGSQHVSPRPSAQPSPALGVTDPPPPVGGGSSTRGSSVHGGSGSDKAKSPSQHSLRSSHATSNHNRSPFVETISTTIANPKDHSPWDTEPGSGYPRSRTTSHISGHSRVQTPHAHASGHHTPQSTLDRPRSEKKRISSLWDDVPHSSSTYGERPQTPWGKTPVQASQPLGDEDGTTMLLSSATPAEVGHHAELPLLETLSRGVGLSGDSVRGDSGEGGDVPLDAVSGLGEVKTPRSDHVNPASVDKITGDHPAALQQQQQQQWSDSMQTPVPPATVATPALSTTSSKRSKRSRKNSIAASVLSSAKAVSPPVKSAINSGGDEGEGGVGSPHLLAGAPGIGSHSLSDRKTWSPSASAAVLGTQEEPPVDTHMSGGDGNRSLTFEGEGGGGGGGGSDHWGTGADANYVESDAWHLNDRPSSSSARNELSTREISPPPLPPIDTSSQVTAIAHRSPGMKTPKSTESKTPKTSASEVAPTPDIGRELGNAEVSTPTTPTATTTKKGRKKKGKGNTVAAAAAAAAEEEEEERKKKRVEEEAERERMRLEQEEQMRLAKEAEEQAEREKIAAAEAERLAKEEQERLAKEEQERLEKEEQERLEKEEQERLAKEEQERLAKEEQERLAKEEQERLAKEEQERLAKEEQERLAKEEQERLEKEEQERLEKEEQERLEKEEQERLAKEEQERLEKEEQERLEKEEQERLAKEEQERLAKEEQERLAKEEQERLAKEEQERLAKEEQERLAKERLEKEEQERLAKEEQERLAIEERQKLEKEELERLLKEEKEEAKATAEREAEAAAAAKAQKDAEDTEPKAKEELERGKEAKAAAAALNEPFVRSKKGKKKKGTTFNSWEDEEEKEKEKMELEIREAEERAMKEKLEQEKADQEAKEKVEQEEKEKAEQEAKEREDAEKKVVEEAKAKAEQEERERIEREAQERAQQEAKDKAEQEAEERAEEERKAEEARKAEEDHLAREKSEQEARAKEEQEKEEMGRKEKMEMETEKDEQGKAAMTATTAGEENTSNSIFNKWGSSSGLGWGLRSWGEKAKSQAPSIKSAFDTAWGTSTFGSFGFGSAGEDSQEELKLVDVGGRLARNSSSLYDNLYHASTTADGHPPDTSATDHAGDANTTHDPPHVLSDRTPSKAQSRAPSRVPTPDPVSTIVPTAENAETTTETLLKADASPHDGLIAPEKPTASGIPTADDVMIPDTSAGDTARPDAEEIPTATAEEDYPVKMKKIKKKTNGNSGVATPMTDGTNETSGQGNKKKKKRK